MCRSTEFECRVEKKCINKDWLCDTVSDCTDGSDEENCPGKYKSDQK